MRNVERGFEGFKARRGDEKLNNVQLGSCAKCV